MGAADAGIKERLSRRGEDALAKVAEELMDNGVVTGTLQAVLDARERVGQAQEVAMEVLNIPSATDLQRLVRRVRSVSQRLEVVEDGIDRIDRRLTDTCERRLGKVEVKLDELIRDLGTLRTSLKPYPEPLPRTQERLAVRD